MTTELQMEAPPAYYATPATTSSTEAPFKSIWEDQVCSYNYENAFMLFTSSLLFFQPDHYNSKFTNKYLIPLQPAAQKVTVPQSNSSSEPVNRCLIIFALLCCTLFGRMASYYNTQVCMRSPSSELE